MKTRVATVLLRQRDDKRRRGMILRYSAVLMLLFVAHSYFSNLSSPLRLIPQTAAAVGMGYFLLFILSLRQFKAVSEFIDWAKVMEIAEPNASPDVSSGGVENSNASGGPPSVS